MPNHMHGIIVINGEGASTQWATHASPLPAKDGVLRLKRRSLGSIVGQFKSASARRINLLRDANEPKLWQRNYYERVIRNESELSRFREYIMDNPLRWREKQDGEL